MFLILCKLCCIECLCVAMCFSIRIPIIPLMGIPIAPLKGPPTQVQASCEMRLVQTPVTIYKTCILNARPASEMQDLRPKYNTCILNTTLAS